MSGRSRDPRRSSAKNIVAGAISARHLTHMKLIKHLLPFLLVATVGTALCDAKPLNVPDDESPIASIEFPKDWDTDTIQDGVVGTSPDGAVYLAVVGVTSEKGMNAEIDSTFEMLQEHKVELDESSKKENKFKVNGFDAQELLFQGKDADGPAAISITFVTIKDKLIVFTYWVSTADEAKHQQTVGKIVSSLKPKA